MAEASETQEQLELESAAETESETQAEAKPDPQAEALEELRAEMRRLAEQNAELRGRVSATAAQPPQQEKPRDLTRGELQQMVDRGDITEIEMEDRLDKQREARLRAEIQKEFELTEARRRSAALFDKYREAIPGLDDPTHENRQRVSREYQKLVASGLPENTQTELTALAMAFGSPDKIREHKPKRETHQETSGGGGAAEQRPGPQWQKGLKSHHIAYQQSLLEKGYYAKGTDDPEFKAYNEYARKGRAAAAH